jgi:hypothetical protein
MVSHAVNFPGNPRFLSWVAFKSVSTSAEMEERKEILSCLTLLVKEVGVVGLRSTEELKDVLFHHFGIRKHELYVYHSHPHPFVVVFPDRHARDIFAAGRVINGPIELSFSAWDLDELGDHTIIPYHVKLSIEELPQHAWSHSVAEKVLCDEAVIHHVEECSLNRSNHHANQCWALSKDPSKIPQVVFLSLAWHEPELFTEAQVHFVRPRGCEECSHFQDSGLHRCRGRPVVLPLPAC